MKYTEEVKAALDVVVRNNDDKTKHDVELWKIQRMFEAGFDIFDLNGVRRFNSKTLIQALWRTVGRMKPHDYQIHGSGRPQYIERVVTKAVEQIMNKGGFLSMLRDKGGIYNTSCLFGDAFALLSTDSESKYPIKFNQVSPTNIYVDTYSTGIRFGGDSGSASELVVVFSYSPKKFKQLYPKIKATGRIPRDLSPKELSQDINQVNKMDDIVEVAHYFDIAEGIYTCFAGTECKVIKTLKGKNYPYVLDGKNYIPVLQFIFMTGSEGFWNFGLGQMLYDLIQVIQKLMNEGVMHIDNNVNPITLVNVPKGEASAFFTKLKGAYTLRDNGKYGIVPVEYDPSNPGASQVSANALLTSNLINEWQIILDRIDREIKRLGINLDDIDYAANTTATQVMAENENSNALIKCAQEYNASEMKFAIEITMDFIKKFVPVTDQTPINLTTKIIDEQGQEVATSNLTMGAIADELKKYNYFVIVNDKTGFMPSNIMEQAQLARVMNVTPPGTNAYGKLYKDLAQLNNREVSDADLQMQMPAAGPQGEVPAEGIPTGTERIAINPRSSNQVAEF